MSNILALLPLNTPLSSTVSTLSRAPVTRLLAEVITEYSCRQSPDPYGVTYEHSREYAQRRSN
jgi:histone H3/H4